MRVLVIDRDRAALAHTAGLVRGLDHEVHTASTDVEARDKLGVAIDVVIIDPKTSGVELIRTVREGHRQPYTYVLAISKQQTDAEIRDAYDAGCDGDVHGPVETIDLRARLAVAARIRSAASPAAAAPKAPPKVVAARPAPAGAKPASAAEAVTRSAAWANMAANLAQASATFLTLPGVIAPADHAAPIVFASGILLSSVESELEARVTLGLDHRDATALAMHLFGESSDELAADVLGEIGNIAMGALKTSFSAESFHFTGSLPKRLAPADVAVFGASGQFVESFCVRLADARLHVRIGIASTKNQIIDMMKLREGMVLAKDLFNARGMLVLAGGTRLSSTTADKLQRTLPTGTTVEIAAGT